MMTPIQLGDLQFEEGQWTVGETGIPYERIKDAVQHGAEAEDIVQRYPSISPGLAERVVRRCREEDAGLGAL